MKLGQKEHNKLNELQDKLETIDNIYENDLMQHLSVHKELSANCPLPKKLQKQIRVAVNKVENSLIELQVLKDEVDAFESDHL